MRSFGIVSPQFWTGRTGREIQAAGTDAIVVAMYLMTSPHSHMCGLYYLSKQYIVDDTGRTLAQVTKGLRSLASLPSGPFAIWDETTKYVWVPTMMRWQIGGTLKPGDKRIAGILSWYRTLPNVPFLKDFSDRYGEELPGLMTREGASKGLLAAPKGHISISIHDPSLVPKEEGLGETKPPCELEPKTYGEFGRVKLTDEQHAKLVARLNGRLFVYIGRFDRWVNDAPDAKANGVKRKDRHAYESILNWAERDGFGADSRASPGEDELKHMAQVKEIFRKKV